MIFDFYLLAKYLRAAGFPPCITNSEKSRKYDLSG
jgi:hypothetical protein